MVVVTSLNFASALPFTTNTVPFGSTLTTVLEASESVILLAPVSTVAGTPLISWSNTLIAVTAGGVLSLSFSSTSAPGTIVVAWMVRPWRLTTVLGTATAGSRVYVAFADAPGAVSVIVVFVTSATVPCTRPLTGTAA